MSTNINIHDMYMFMYMAHSSIELIVTYRSLGNEPDKVAGASEGWLAVSADFSIHSSR